MALHEHTALALQLAAPLRQARREAIIYTDGSYWPGEQHLSAFARVVLSDDSIGNHFEGYFSSRVVDAFEFDGKDCISSVNAELAGLTRALLHCAQLDEE